MLFFLIGTESKVVLNDSISLFDHLKSNGIMELNHIVTLNNYYLNIINFALSLNF